MIYKVGFVGWERNKKDEISFIPFIEKKKKIVIDN